MNINACLSHKTDEYSTPKDLFNRLDREYGFDLDLCASDSNYLCKKYETIKSNWDLQKKFSDLCIWCNPPYSKLKQFVKYCYELAFIYHNDIVLLIPARTDTIAFHEYIYKQENVSIEFLKGRLKFGGLKGCAPFPSMLVFMKGRV